MNKRRIVSQIAALVSASFLIISFMQSVYAVMPEKQTVKVAYFDMGDYYSEVFNGIVNSYDTDMLSKISSYSNLSFEYVNCKTWENALNMLRNHEIDLVGTVQWTPERENEYEYCLEGYGYTVGELATLPGKNYVYEDYNTIGNCVIGVTANYVRISDMNDLFRKKGISPMIKTYAGQSELENALETGEVDMIAANSHTLKEEWTVVEKFSFAPYYMISWKGNTQLTNKIDDAIIAINLREPNIDDELLKKYFPSIIGAPLTKEELNLIAENNTYTIYYDTTTKPLVWQDMKTFEMKGVLVDICKQLTEITGLKIDVKPILEAPKKPTDTTIKYSTLFKGTSVDLSKSSGVTDALINESFNLFYCTNDEIDLLNDNYNIAVVKNRNLLNAYLKEKYPKCTVTEYATPIDCLKALRNGETDLAYLNIRVADSALLESGILGIREFPIASTEHGIGMIFSGENSELLASIVNKGIQKLNQNEISKLFVQYALNEREPLNLNNLIKNHMGLLLLVIIIAFIAILAIAILFTYARVMKKQKDKIASADEEKTEFFSRMSHDMRTPMNGILGMIRLTKDANNMEEVMQNMIKAEDAGEYMLSLINDTLDLQRLESKRLKLEYSNVLVKNYYDSIFSIMKVSADQKKIDFKVKYLGIDIDNYIEIDSVRLKQILSNLISNAIKFTPSGGAVEVTIESLGQDGDILHRRYQVKDTGVGMSKDFIQNRLFKPYSQEKNELSVQLTGSGLGMAITKNLVEIMGGKLEVESTLGEGTTFSFIVDIKRTPKEVALKFEKERKEKNIRILSDLYGKRILLCEDHPLNAEITKRMLEKVRCKVEWAENGQLGVSCFQESDLNYFDAILMDMRMPVMDGLEATRKIRALIREDAASVPIIALTANAYDSDIRHCIEAGMNAHLSKPIEPETLYFELTKLL